MTTSELHDLVRGKMVAWPYGVVIGPNADGRQPDPSDDLGNASQFVEWELDDESSEHLTPTTSAFYGRVRFLLAIEPRSGVTKLDAMRAELIDLLRTSGDTGVHFYPLEQGEELVDSSEAWVYRELFFPYMRQEHAA